MSKNMSKISLLYLMPNTISKIVSDIENHFNDMSDNLEQTISNYWKDELKSKLNGLFNDLEGPLEYYISFYPTLNNEIIRIKKIRNDIKLIIAKII